MKNKKLSLKPTDKEGTILIKEQLQFVKKRIIQKKVDSLNNQGFHKIVLSGHSEVAWVSITLKTKFPEKIDGVIALNPAFAGPKKGRSSFWEDIRKYGINLINFANLKNIIVFSNNKDKYETPKSLSILSNSESVNFNDSSSSKCKGKVMLGGYHGITLTKYFVEMDSYRKEIIKFLERIL